MHGETHSPKNSPVSKALTLQVMRTRVHKSHVKNTCMVVCAFNPNTEEVETGSVGIGGQPVLQNWWHMM